MSGIVAYIGKRNASNILIEGLNKLEYRGYDSAGVSILEDEEIITIKRRGKLSDLKKLIDEKSMTGNVGIGHTRWATHGGPSDINSHPHLNEKSNIGIVHNGIIENYQELKKELEKEGYKFKTETDSEVIVHLLDFYNVGDIKKALLKVVDRIEGTYALAVLTKDNPKEIIAIKKENPLVIGLGEGENFIASDIPAILNYTRNVYFLEDNELVTITDDNVVVTDLNGNTIKKEVFNVTWDEELAEKDGYDHFMIKEIHEQPKAIRDTMSGRISKNSDSIKLDDIKLTKDDLKNIDRIFIVACGTAYHAGLVGKHAIEKLAKIPVEVEIASEFRYGRPLIDERTLVIAISQSGETADTLGAIREAKRKNSRVMVITNVVGSVMSREVKDILYTWAGPEISVASTKAYTTQLIAVYMVALHLGSLNGKLKVERFREIRDEMLNLPEKVERVLNVKDDVKEYAKNNFKHSDMFFVGRGVDSAVALEGSLKLKETSYIHAEAYAAGELKHGPMALIEEGVPIVAVATQEYLYDKMVSNVREIVNKGAKALTMVTENWNGMEELSEKVIYIPETLPILTPAISIVPLQLLSYYISIEKGINPDKPKNLAKAVTI